MHGEHGGANFTAMRTSSDRHAPAPPPPPPPAAHVRERQAALLRFALFAGVVLFGAVTWFVHRDPQWRAPAPALVESLRLATYAVWAVGVVAVLVARGIHARARDESRQGTALLGWAIGESVAIFGAVYYFMTDDPWRYFYGIVFMLATFILFPVRRR